MSVITDVGSAEEIALFPLGTVLFPGGRLPLRIFEPRYVDMVGDCMRRDRPFGVISISRGSEVGTTPEFHASGTLAVIGPWDQGNDGVLQITAHGHERFEIVSHHVRENGLLVGTIRSANEDDAEVPAQLEHLKALLREVFATRSELRPPEPWHLDRAAWVSYRLAELLPLTIETRLKVLNLTSGVDKLDVVANYLAAHDRAKPNAPSH
jgi:Lon protease-like protein